MTCSERFEAFHSMSTLKELPNLNFGLSVKQLHCQIHPSVVPNILDHYLRRPEDQEIVAGTLLGTIDGHTVQICSSFAVPLLYDSSDDTFVIDSDYQQKMLKFYSKVNPKESLQRAAWVMARF